MARSRISCMFSLALVWLVSTARSEEKFSDYYHNGRTSLASHATVASMSKQIADLETQLASFETLESRLAAIENGGCDACGAEASCGCESNCANGCCDDCWGWWTRPNCGLTGMAEILWLRPQHSDPGTNGGTQYHHGSRFTVGYLNDCGREFRIRAFELGAQMTPNDFVNFFALDVEYAGRFNWGCNWAGEVSMGLRYADFHEGGDNESENNITDSVGPVAGIHLKSDVLAWNTNLFGTARYSLQFGHENGGDLASFGIFELQGGLEWYRQTCNANMFARVFLEAQNWTGDFDGSDEDLGLIGLGVALGLTR